MKRQRQRGVKPESTNPVSGRAGTWPKSLCLLWTRSKCTRTHDCEHFKMGAALLPRSQHLYSQQLLLQGASSGCSVQVAWMTLGWGPGVTELGLCKSPDEAGQAWDQQGGGGLPHQVGVVRLYCCLQSRGHLTVLFCSCWLWPSYMKGIIIPSLAVLLHSFENQLREGLGKSFFSQVPCPGVHVVCLQGYK